MKELTFALVRLTCLIAIFSNIGAQNIPGEKSILENADPANLNREILAGIRRMQDLDRGDTEKIGLDLKKRCVSNIVVMVGQLKPENRSQVLVQNPGMRAASRFWHKWKPTQLAPETFQELDPLMTAIYGELKNPQQAARNSSEKEIPTSSAESALFNDLTLLQSLETGELDFARKRLRAEIMILVLALNEALGPNPPVEALVEQPGLSAAALYWQKNPAAYLEEIDPEEVRKFREILERNRSALARGKADQKPGSTSTGGNDSGR